MLSSTVSYILNKTLGSYILTTRTHSRINHDNVVLVVVMKIFHELTHLAQGVPLGVISKYPTPVHVVDIIPHGLQGDASPAVVLNHFCRLVDIPVAIFAVLELCTLAHIGLSIGRQVDIHQKSNSSA